MRITLAPRLRPAALAVAALVLVSTLTRVVLALRADAVVPGGAPALAREGIAFYQLASHLFRSGLYADEEQVPPQARNASNAARQVATHARR